MLSECCVGTFGAVNQIDVWLLRAVWLVMPFTTGPLFETALSDSRAPFRTGVSIGLWLVWGAMLVLIMVPRTETFSAVRIVAPASLVAVVWALIDVGSGAPSGERVIAGLGAAAATALSLRSQLADSFVDGSSYGDERRFLLGTPGALLVGPLLIVWVVTVAGAIAGPLALLDQRWLLGAILLVAGAPIAWFGARTLHRLSNRWLVFVPAGIVVHDKTALREPQLFRAADIARFGPAPVDADETDLSLSALGLALRVALNEPTKIIENSRSDDASPTEINGFIISPNRPGAVVAEANKRGYPIG